MDDFEDRVVRGLRRVALPPAPEALRARVNRVTATRPTVRQGRHRARGRSTLLIAAVAVLLTIAGGALLLTGGYRAVLPNRSSQTANPATTASPGPTPVAQATLPTEVDGLPVLTVSEAIAKRDAGGLGTNPIAVRGYWSDGSVGHSCAPPDQTTGELEIYCHDREFGITELDEPIVVITNHGYMTEGSGPWLTPYLTEDIAGVADLFNLPIINGQRFPPTPIVVVGHFNDPRAEKCRPTARKLCRDRLVLDRIVQFQPGAVPTPAPTPTPTPFPYADPPPAPYDAASCAEGHPIKFAGWTTLSSLGIDIASPDEIAYIVITRDPIPIGGWFDDPNDGSRYRLWGQRVCYAYEWEPGATGFTAMPGTMFRESPDGHHEPTQAP